MGWNSLSFPSEGKLFRGIPEGTDVYFVHSYYLPVNPDVKAVTEYGTMIGASVEKDHVFACQFHPEKSGKWGLKILENFLKL
jgi:glutamine amidotransferase